MRLPSGTSIVDNRLTPVGRVGGTPAVPAVLPSCIVVPGIRGSARQGWYMDRDAASVARPTTRSVPAKESPNGSLHLVLARGRTDASPSRARYSGHQKSSSAGFSAGFVDARL